ncbi:hypothetical protein [Thermococcus sp.]|nr:hypothetical protein [Thermococcus sp.]
MEELRGNGFRISDEVVKRILREAGEV